MTRRKSRRLSQESAEESEEISIEESDISSASPKSVLGKRKRSASQSSSQPTPKRRKTRRTSLEEIEDEEEALPSNQLDFIPVVMFTGISTPGKYEKIVTSLNGKIAKSVKQCTHLVTDKVRRTVKFLTAIGLKKQIVSIEWLKACKKAKTWIDSQEYIISDDESEEKFKFTLRSTLLTAKDTSLYSNYSFYTTPNVKPPKGEIQKIIESADGKVDIVFFIFKFQLILINIPFF